MKIALVFLVVLGAVCQQCAADSDEDNGGKHSFIKVPRRIRKIYEDFDNQDGSDLDLKHNLGHYGLNGLLGDILALLWKLTARGRGGTLSNLGYGGRSEHYHSHNHRDKKEHKRDHAAETAALAALIASLKENKDKDHHDHDHDQDNTTIHLNIPQYPYPYPYYQPPQQQIQYVSPPQQQIRYVNPPPPRIQYISPPQPKIQYISPPQPKIKYVSAPKSTVQYVSQPRTRVQYVSQSHDEYHPSFHYGSEVADSGEQIQTGGYPATYNAGRYETSSSYGSYPGAIAASGETVEAPGVHVDSEEVGVKSGVVSGTGGPAAGAAEED